MTFINDPIRMGPGLIKGSFQERFCRCFVEGNRDFHSEVTPYGDGLCETRWLMSALTLFIQEAG